MKVEEKTSMLDPIKRLGLMIPIDEDLVQQRRLAPGLLHLQGVVAGFLDNRKTNANRLLERLREALQGRFGLSEIVWREKFIYSRTAAPEIIEELAERCQFVITAIGD